MLQRSQGFGKKAKKENKRHYVKRKTAMADCMAAERNDMGHSQKAGFDTLTKSQSCLFPPCRRPWENYAKTAWSSPHERATTRYCLKGTLTKPRRSISCNTATNPSQNPSKANKTTFFR